MLTIYLSLLSLCFLASFRKLFLKNFLWAYFLYVIIVEVLVNFFSVKDHLYIYSILIYIIYFFFFYAKKIHKKAVVAISLVLFLISFYFIVSSNQVESYNINAGISLSIFYILISLLWFYTNFQKTNRKIHHKLGFWVSSSLLLWGVAFIFRIIPMQFFNIKDKEFLLVITQLYQSFTILSYVIFLVGILYSKADE